MPLGNAPSVAQDKYNGILGTLGAQKRSRLRSRVTEKSHTAADIQYWDIKGNLSFKKKTTRRQRTAWEEANIFKKRGVALVTGECPIVWDEDDDQVLNYSLDDPIFESMIDAANRDIDDDIILALDADVTELDTSSGNKTPSTVSFSTDYQISADIGAANSSLNHAKLEAILAKFNQLEVSEHEMTRPVLVCTEHEITELIREVRNEVAFNGDSAALGMLTEILQKNFGSYYGFDFVVSNRLGTLGDDTKCFAFYRTGVIFALGYDVRVRIFQDGNESDAWKMRGKHRTNALRFMDDRVLRVLCDTDATYNAS